MKVMPHFTSYEGQIKNVVFAALDFKEIYVQYTFSEALNVLHIFSIYEGMRKWSSVVGALEYNHFMKAIEAGVGPVTIFEIED
jgi:hypothetical protein